jgi:hypothetical protein
MSEENKQAIETLSAAMKEDPEYAWAWHCNFAMPFVDEGGTHQQANRAAARIMRVFFNVDTGPRMRRAFADLWKDGEP